MDRPKPPKPPGTYRREILFRGLGVNGDWYYGNLAVMPKKIGEIDPGFYISNKAGMPWAYQVRPETVGQFTGTLDKNGAKIFEDDNVRYAFDFDDAKSKRKVTWYEGKIYWDIGHCGFVVGPHRLIFNSGNFCQIEITGNINQNNI